MKLIPLLLILFIEINTFSQNDSIEKAFIYGKVNTGKMEPEDFQSLGLNWNEKLKEIKGYPEIPFDDEGKVHFTFQVDYPQLMKRTLFDRIMEWCCINYGPDTRNYYNDLYEGKIIIPGNFSLNINTVWGNSLFCYYTYIFTVYDEKIYVELINLEYEYIISYNENGDPRTGKFAINSLFPIILKKSKEWDSDFKLILTTKTQIDNILKSLDKYIVEYNSKY